MYGITPPFQETASSIGLEVEMRWRSWRFKENMELTNMLTSEEWTLNVENNLNYLGSLLTHKSESKVEVLARITPANKCFFSLLPLMSNETKDLCLTDQTIWATWL